MFIGLKPWHVHACSLVELLGLLVKSRALLDCDKALETQCLPCLGDGSNPSALLAKRRPFLAHDLAVLVATKPLRPNAFLALVTAAIQALFLPNADLFLLTILPFLFKEAAVIPPTVFSLDPRKTNTFAILPLAILLTVFFFMAFMAFMAAIAFIAFIALAIVKEERMVFEGVRSLCHLSPALGDL